MITVERFNKMVQKKPRGAVIEYYRGCYYHRVGGSPVGRAAWDAYAAGKVDLFQRKIGDEDFIYIARVK